MVLIPNNQDLSAGSGVINKDFMEAIYHSFIDESFMDLGRKITIHLPPIQEQDTTTQAQLPPQQYNPFFSRVPVPGANTRNSGTKITPRDVEYDAHIVVGPFMPPRMANENRLSGMGWLNTNEAMITLVIGALEHVVQAQSISIEGRRYAVVETRPIGFSVRRYLMVKLRAIQETDLQSPDKTVG
jgi:hypothetical protein